ncbi:MAG: hypothetical protein OEY63_03720, partial [Gemmatimonadota bacterium]|nr:hypothetical protein [Gemmatimonadota bacterium]
SFPLQIQTAQQIAGQVRTVRLLGLGSDYLDTYRDRLDAVDADDISEVTRRVIHPDSAVIVVVGDGAEIYEKLTSIAPVRLVDTDGNEVPTAELAPETAPLPVNPDRLMSMNASYDISMQGQQMGTQTVQILVDGDSVIIREQTSVPIASMQGNTWVILEAASLAPRSSALTLSTPIITANVNAVFGEEKVVGNGAMPTQTGQIQEVTIDAPITEDLTTVDAIRVLLTTMDLAPGQRFVVSALDLNDGSVRPITIEVGEPEEITVPAGTFQAYPVNISGNENPAVLHISVDDSQLIRMSPTGQPITFELTGSQ